jgi:hypothetical protein
VNGGYNAPKDKAARYDHIRQKMTQKRWEERFDQLMRENLIDIDAQFYKDDLPFADPSRLGEIFADLEEENLKMIHEMQEKEQQLEKLRSDEIRMHANLDAKHTTH